MIDAAPLHIDDDLEHVALHRQHADHARRVDIGDVDHAEADAAADEQQVVDLLRIDDAVLVVVYAPGRRKREAENLAVWPPPSLSDICCSIVRLVSKKSMRF